MDENLFNYNSLHNKILEGKEILDRDSIINNIIYYRDKIIYDYVNSKHNINNKIIIGNIYSKIHSKKKPNEYQKKLIKWMYNIEKKIRENYNNIYIYDTNIIKINNIYCNIKLKRFHLQTPLKKKIKFKGGIIINSCGYGKTVGSLLLTNIKKEKIYRKFIYDNNEGIISRTYIESNSTLIISNKDSCKKIYNEILEIFYNKRAKIITKENIKEINYDKLLTYEYVIIDYITLYKLYKYYINNKKLDLLKNNLDNIKIEILRNPNILYLNSPLLHNIRWGRIIIDNFHIVYKYNIKFPIISLLSILNTKYKWIITGYYNIKLINIKDIINILFSDKYSNNIELIKYTVNNLFYYDEKNYSNNKIIKKLVYNKLENYEIEKYDINDSEKETCQMLSNIFINDKYNINNKLNTIEKIKKDILNNNLKDIGKINNKIIYLNKKKEKNYKIIKILKKENIEYNYIYTKCVGIDKNITILEKKIYILKKKNMYISKLSNNSNIKCPICLNEYKNDIIVTKCGHYYCKQCIIKLSNYFTKDFFCSTCREKLNNNNIYYLDNNINITNKYSSKINKLIDYLNKINNRKTIILTQWKGLIVYIKKIINKKYNNIYIYNSNIIFDCLHLDNIEYIILLEPILYFKNLKIVIEDNINMLLDVNKNNNVNLIHLITKDTIEDIFK